jgi:hypothetical protein
VLLSVLGMEPLSGMVEGRVFSVGRVVIDGAGSVDDVVGFVVISVGFVFPLPPQPVITPINNTKQHAMVNNFFIFSSLFLLHDYYDTNQRI